MTQAEIRATLNAHGFDDETIRLAEAGHTYWRDHKFLDQPAVRKAHLAATPAFWDMNGSAMDLFLMTAKGIREALRESERMQDYNTSRQIVLKMLAEKAHIWCTDHGVSMSGAYATALVDYLLNEISAHDKGVEAAKQDIAKMFPGERKSEQPEPACESSGRQALREALKRSMVALDDWLNIYASDHCDEQRVKEARQRVNEYGTIHYIGTVQDRNRAALSPQTDSCYSPHGNYCSICDLHDKWCAHISPPQTDSQEPR